MGRGAREQLRVGPVAGMFKVGKSQSFNTQGRITRTPDKTSPKKFKEPKVERSQSGHSVVVKKFTDLDKARAAGKKVNEARQKAQQKFPKPKAITQQELMKKTQPITHPPNPKAPAKSIAQTRNANIVNKMFGGSTKITQRGGGGGFGATLSQGTGSVARKPGPGGR